MGMGAGVVGVGVVGTGAGVVGAGVMVWVVQSLVARARSVLVLARRESIWRTEASMVFWAAGMEAVEPECDEPEDFAVALLSTVPDVVVLLVAVPLGLPVPLLALAVPGVTTGPAVAVWLAVPATPPAPDTAET
jgi:hypothetical protein